MLVEDRNTCKSLTPESKLEVLVEGDSKPEALASVEAGPEDLNANWKSIICQLFSSEQNLPFG